MSSSALDVLVALFDERARGQRKLAVLTGAGISRAAPSHLPVVTAMLTPILKELIPTPGVAAELLRAENPLRRNTKEFLRFETYCELLVKQKVDPELEFLDPLGDCVAVNRNHMLMAGLIQKGHAVFTTNFDALIELACERVGFQPDVLAYPNDYARFLEQPSAMPLFKLHGSLEVRGKPARDSLRACLDQIARAGGDDHVRLEEPKRRVLEHVLRDHDLIVLGYSGADDLDIGPALARIKAPGTKLIWVNHTPSSQPSQLIRGHEIAFAPKDKNGHHLAERTHLLAGLVASGRRQPDDVMVADADTDNVVEALSAAYGVTLPHSTDSEFVFDPADFAERWLKRRLPRQLQRWYIGAHILAERERYVDAIALYDRCLSVASGARERLSVSGAKVNMLLRLERFDDADKQLSATESEARSLRDLEVLSGWLHQAGYARYNLGQRAFDRRDWDEAARQYARARPAYEESLRLARQRGAPEEVSATLHQLGLLNVNNRQPKRFRLLEALLSQRGSVGRVRRRLSRIPDRLWLVPVNLLVRWDRRSGERCYREAADIARKHGLLGRYVESMGQLASLLHLKKDYRGEVLALHGALELARPLGRNYLLTALYGQLGRAFMYLRAYEAACDALVVAEQHAALGDPLAADVDQALRELRDRMGPAAFDPIRGSAQAKPQADLIAGLADSARRFVSPR